MQYNLQEYVLLLFQGYLVIFVSVFIKNIYVKYYDEIYKA